MYGFVGDEAQALAQRGAGVGFGAVIEQQAGEGSVRDSLSALDQAIACCGAKLVGLEVRGLIQHWRKQ